MDGNWLQHSKVGNRVEIYANPLVNPSACSRGGWGGWGQQLIGDDGDVFAIFVPYSQRCSYKSCGFFT